MIFVFKTSVKTNSRVQQLRPYIDEILPAAKWNFDLGDCDSILRIESDENIVLQITILLNIHTFNCEELQ